MPPGACRARRAIWQLRKHGVPYRVELRDTGSCGMGVFALEAIPGGAPLVEYLGEMISEEEVGGCWRKGTPGAVCAVLALCCLNRM